MQASARLRARVTAVRGTAGSRRRLAVSASSTEYAALQGLSVVSAADGFQTELLSLWQVLWEMDVPDARRLTLTQSPPPPLTVDAQPKSTTTVVVPFLTHFADLSSWELGQKLIKIMPQLKQQGVQVITVGLGSAENARSFAATLSYPLEGLYADPTGACYKALQFSPGFAPGTDINPYMKLLPMLAGIGSPGTLQEVIRGYIGDRSAGPVFEASSPFDILGTGYQRPFELATLRLFNMVGILPKWGELSPLDASLLVQQGGTLVFRGTDVVFRHDDSGILKYTNTDDLLAAVAKAGPGSSSSTAALPVPASNAPQDGSS